jgi:hypothetical protein
MLTIPCQSCFPHVINLAVQAFLDAIKTLNSDYVDVDQEVADAVKDDPVKRCRELVAAIRLTSQRRDEFRKVVSDGQTSGGFDGEKLELLRDVIVRWSSTYHMIHRFLVMSKVSFNLASSLLITDFI